MMKAMNMPVVVCGVKGLGRLVPGIARQMGEPFEKSGRWEREILAKKVAQIHVKIKDGRR